MRKVKGLFWLVVCAIFAFLTGFIIYCAPEVLREGSATATQGFWLAFLAIAGCFYTMLCWRASRYAFKGRSRRFWRIINNGWLPL